jgi:hypothetical protein
MWSLVGGSGGDGLVLGASGGVGGRGGGNDNGIGTTAVELVLASMSSR